MGRVTFVDIVFMALHWMLPVFFPNQVSSYSPPSSGRELYLLQRVQEAEEKWAAAHGLTQQLKAASLQKEKEMETKILEMKMQQDKELFQLNQENYVLRTQVLNPFHCSIEK